MGEEITSSLHACAIEAVGTPRSSLPINGKNRVIDYSYFGRAALKMEQCGISAGSQQR
jgi:hypothetical protein